MDNEETEVRSHDLDIADKAIKELQRNQRLLSASAEWFYRSDDPVRVRMQILEDSISNLTDLLVLQGKLSTSLGWQTAHVQEPQN
ncbi:hypothetical protein [Bifidobacterium crudilactis]|uniref:hypothetical protein n=1 Tax=Bifidobacterium crudilactis TaxID=327277 RepID=UPI0026495477|nr:hypothetical protein [Bifidobacterium crudilactis]MDN5973453.1 hypothetical protein [Bifidobacterium crudilactis]MDN6210147.1 hypothetical protein [Bifidobacterium crudilactis]MDN6458406.1 hypothetical protein [Bifidobacterium crudilactis]MDN6468231.1 hypothetical protein [Bifidobacterium crudilactis]MDN6559299.1 hypothetical protein [Bifidobacterium crudilactis]